MIVSGGGSARNPRDWEGTRERILTTQRTSPLFSTRRRTVSQYLHLASMLLEYSVHDALLSPAESRRDT